MYIDPGATLTWHWERDILDRNDAVSMWNFFTDSLSCMLDSKSIEHLIRCQGHLVRMYYLFALMSVVPQPLGESRRYVVRVNDEDYLLKNIHCIQCFNSALSYHTIGNIIHIEPLPINFIVDSFSDRQTYNIPEILGGKRLAYTIFADDC